MFEKTIKSKRIYKGRMIGMRDDTVQMATGRISHREICEHPGAVAVVAITDKKEVVLIRQFRKPAEKVLYEIPAGLFEKGEAYKAAAKRELREETGFVSKKIKHLTSIYTTPGYSTELLHIFLATGLELTEQSYEEDEHIEVEVVPIKKAAKMIIDKKIVDGKTIVGILMANKILTPTYISPLLRGRKRGGGK
ncbi:NUDIX hydrolase [Candidatus Saganbacteria bacterium]|nr:NUDIX hydrolase [Candidatus Saganbacteria bacterium]